MPDCWFIMWEFIISDKRPILFRGMEGLKKYLDEKKDKGEISSYIFLSDRTDCVLVRFEPKNPKPGNITANNEWVFWKCDQYVEPTEINFACLPSDA